MRRYWMFILLLSFTACIREGNGASDCSYVWRLEMLPVPYILENDTPVEYKPYYDFVNTLDILCFEEQHLVDKSVYDYEYCRNTPVIPFPSEAPQVAFLCVANLLEHKAMTWRFEEGRPQAEFAILDHREPPVYLASAVVSEDTSRQIPVRLNLLVAHLMIEVVNSLSWMEEMEVRVENVVGKVTNDYQYRDTTYIEKTIALNQADGRTLLGLNTFPNYRDVPARLALRFKGGKFIANYVILDSQLSLQPHSVLFIRIVFEDVNSIKVYLSINGKWQIIDEGHIII